MHRRSLVFGVLAAALGGTIVSACGLADAGKVPRSCRNSRDYAGDLRPYHSVSLDGGLEFSRLERFPTGSPGYSAFATWDECTLYLGFTGPALGPGRCDDPSRPGCSAAELGGSPFRFLLVYLDTDPLGRRGTRGARAFGSLEWRLPFRADYLLAVRTDGYTERRGDSLAFVGNARAYRWTTLWSTSVERTWTGAEQLARRVGGEPGAGSVVIALDLEEIGSPCAVQVVGWIADTALGETFAHWPAAPAPDTLRTDPERREPEPEPDVQAALPHYYGFVLDEGIPPASSLNLNRLAYPDCAD